MTKLFRLLSQTSRFKERYSLLSVYKNRDSIKNYYGDNVDSATLFLGENGMGKTTLLDILGMWKQC